MTQMLLEILTGISKIAETPFIHIAQLPTTNWTNIECNCYWFSLSVPTYWLSLYIFICV